MVLKLSFVDIDVSSTYDVFLKSLTDIINNSILRLKTLYQKAEKDRDIIIDSQNSISSFQSLCQCVEIMDKKLYILIDEYDTALNQLIIQKCFSNFR